MKLCDTCIYRNNVEQLKPCIIYRDDCKLYEKERDDMTDDLISRQAVKDLIKSGICTDTYDDMKYVCGLIDELPSVTPTQNCISRQAVLDLAEKGILVGNHNYKSVCNAINDLPSVTPTERTGHWIKDGYTRRCSECGYSTCGTDDEGNYIPDNYCPDCGKRMDHK